MFPHSAATTIEHLHRLLQRLEQENPTTDPEALAELRRIMLNRIAALQLEEVESKTPPFAA